MSTIVRQYLYTAEDIYGKDALDEGMSRDEIWHAYEAARTKDAELIQKLVNALQWYVEEDDVLEGDFSAEGGTNWDEENAPWIEGRNEAISILEAAASAGFKPSEE